jgi:hypothetical protein
MNAKLVMNTAYTKERFSTRFLSAQKFLDNEVLKDCAPYVPMRTGQLMRSGQNGTNIGSGQVVYNAPYAKKVYYATKANFSRAKHPQASSQWFEKAKAIKKKDWINGANMITVR